MKRKIINWVVAGLLIVGLGLIAYPAAAAVYASYFQTRAIEEYQQQLAEAQKEQIEQLQQEAEAYNARLPELENRWKLTKAQQQEYKKTLALDAQGMMGYLIIDKIDVYLPIYHGTSEKVLETGIGHLEGTSLPCGGLGTHSVLSGHRGLASARLLTRLDEMKPGDLFLIKTLDEVLAYETDDIQVVLPDQLESLKIEPDQDYCTLVTCTPYGINTHRLLVRGHRVELPPDAVQKAAVKTDYTLFAAGAGLLILIAAGAGLIVWRRRKHRRS